MQNKITPSYLLLGTFTSILIAQAAGCALADTGSIENAGNTSNSGGESSVGGSGTGGVAGGGFGGSGSSSGPGGMSGTGGSMTSSSSSSSSSGNPNAEMCKDNMDNDGDSLVDCADVTDCGSLFSCKPQPPAGWSYVHIRQTSFNAAPENCPSGQTPTTYYEGPNDAVCNNCSCNAGGGKCEVTLSCYSTDNCIGTVSSSSFSTSGCKADSVASGGGSCMIFGLPTVPANAVCNSTGGGLVDPNPYSKEVHVCRASSNATGCSGTSCVFTPKGNYENRLCISRSGDLPCPPEFVEKHATFSSYNDLRSCTECSCSPSMLKCGMDATITLWDNATCSSQVNKASVGTASGCVNVPSGLTHVNATGLPSQQVALCPNSVATGFVSSQGPQTICCPMQ